MRDVIGGDASFDWTIWYLSARDLCMSGELHGQHRRIIIDLMPGQGYDWLDASCDAEKYALGLSRLGWCLRDAGMAAACERRGFGEGYDLGCTKGYEAGRDVGYSEGYNECEAGEDL